MLGAAGGVCGAAGIEALRGRGAVPLGETGGGISAEVLCGLPERMAQGKGGGLLAAGLFGFDGTPVAVRTDVRAVNAVDKLTGWGLLAGRLPLAGHILLVGGEVGYEVVRRALVAGVPVVCGVAAPSSLAVSLAGEFGMTLVGSLRGERFNVYTDPGRLDL
ncbi:hypothetical protein Misp01_05620 [Microtetraspora sp. NBRC 13810]|nr:hypothetical protein Misp01_05620 [Microtetraspora sp. NBRC 13810]